MHAERGQIFRDIADILVLVRPDRITMKRAANDFDLTSRKHLSHILDFFFPPIISRMPTAGTPCVAVPDKRKSHHIERRHNRGKDTKLTSLWRVDCEPKLSFFQSLLSIGVSCSINAFSIAGALYQ